MSDIDPQELELVPGGLDGMTVPFPDLLLPVLMVILRATLFVMLEHVHCLTILSRDC